MSKFFSFLLLFIVACQSKEITQTNILRTPNSKLGQQSAAAPNMNLVASNTPYVSKIESDEDFDTISSDSKGLVTSGKATKFIIDNRDLNNPQIYFMNSQYKENGKTPDSALFHMYFSMKYLKYVGSIDKFNSSTYFVDGVENKKFIAGTIQSYSMNIDNKSQPIYGVQFYPQDLISEKTILYTLKLVKQNVNFKNPISFIAYGSQQTVKTVSKELHNEGIESYSISDLLASQSTISMNEGQAWGYLRWQPKANQNLNYMDIPVFNEIPLDLSVVAGVITTQIQNPGSHINLKSKERGTPNIIVLSKDKVAELELLKDKPVHLTVLANGFSIVEVQGSNGKTAAQIINEKNQIKLGDKWARLKPIVKSQLTWFDDMCPLKVADCLNANPKFGGKASKLGFLAQKSILGEAGPFVTSHKINYRLTPYGFAVPLQNYNNFIKKNTELDQLLTLFIKEEKAGLYSTEERAEKVAQIQKLFHQGKIPTADFLQTTDLVKKMVANVQTKYGIILKKYKVRSSANVEDIPGFDGAGLHSSFTANLKDLETDHLNCEEVIDSSGTADDVETKAVMKPSSLACAIKGVYASLWNQRAIEERSYRRIDHETAAMGLAIHLNYNFQKEKGLVETANTVILTRVLNTDAVYGYTLNTQKGENLATNPDPGTSTEYTIATFLEAKDIPQYSLIQKAIPVKGQPELNDFVVEKSRRDLSVDIARHLEYKYCLSNKDYYKGGCDNVITALDKAKSLDLEIKYLGDNQLMVKQMREFAGK